MSVVKPHIPDGLIELMKTLAKSVLKEKSENIHEFAAEHFENLLIERDGSLDKGYEKSKSCEKCLTPKEKVFLEFVWNSRPKLFNESNLKTSNTSEKKIAENKFHPQKLSSKKTSNILLSIKEEDEGTQKLSEKEKIAACIIQKAFKAYIERRQLQEHPGNESDGMTENTAAIIIQKALKRVLNGNKSVGKNNVVTKPEISSENNNEDNIDKQMISESLENCIVMDVSEENHKSQEENMKGEAVKVLAENKDVPKAYEYNDINTSSNITTKKNKDEEVQQNEDFSRQDTLPMDETAEIYNDEIGTQEFRHTNDLVQKYDKNNIIIARDDNSQHFATLPEVVRNESELTKALWYIGEEPIITASEETISSSHIEKDITSLMNVKNIINSPESTLSKTLRESAVGANHSVDAPLSMIYDSSEFSNNNQLAGASIEADNLQNISEIKNSLNFVSTDIKFIGGQVEGDSVGVELTSDTRLETGSSLEARQNDNSGSLDTKEEGKRVVVAGRNQEGNKNGIIEEAKQIEEIKENINSDTQSEKENEKSSEFAETKAELSEGSAMLNPGSTKIEYDIDEVDDGSKKLINYEEGEESTITHGNVNRVTQKEYVIEVETVPEYVSTLPESTSTDEEWKKQDHNVPDNINLKIARYSEIAKNVNSEITEEISIKNIDDAFKSVDTDIEKEEGSEICESENLSNLEIEVVAIIQSNSEIVTTSLMQNKQKLQPNVDDLITSDDGIKEEDNVSTPPKALEREIQEAEKNIIQSNTNLILSSEAKTSPEQNSIEESIIKMEVNPTPGQVSQSSNNDIPANEPIINVNKHIIAEKEVAAGAIGTEDKIKDIEANNKRNDETAQESNKVEENVLQTSLTSELHRQSKFLVEDQIAGNQTDKSLRISTECSKKEILAQEVIENESYEVSGKEAGQHLQEIEINKKAEAKFEKISYSINKQDESGEYQEKKHFEGNIKQDNIEYQISTTKKTLSIEENPESIEYLTNVQGKTEIKEESEENFIANEHVKPSFNTENTSENVYGHKLVKSASDKNINNSVKNQTGEENLENPKNLTNFQQKEISGEYEEKPSISHNIEPFSDKQHTNDNVKVFNSQSVKSESTENINENDPETQTIAQEKSATIEENLTNAQDHEEVIERNVNIKLADSKADNKGNSQDNITQSTDNEKLNISQDEESEVTDMLKETSENHEETATKDVPGNLENIQPLTEHKNENDSENMVENTNNNSSQKSVHVYDAVDHKSQATAEINLEVTEAKDVRIKKDNAKIGETEYFNNLQSNEIKELSLNGTKDLEDQEMTYLASDDDKGENKKKCAKQNKKEERATDLPLVIAGDNIDQPENESPIDANILDNIPIPSISEVGDGSGGKTVQKDKAKEDEVEDKLQINQSTNLMEDPAPVNKITEQKDELKEAVKNNSLNNLNPPDMSADLNNESNLNSSVANHKYESSDVEVELTKPRDYVNTNLVLINKGAADEPKNLSDSIYPALKTSEGIEDKEQAAIQIQKMYRGYKTRNDLKKKTEDVDLVIQEIVPDKNASNSDRNEDENVIDAIKEQQNTEFDNGERESALTIQKTFRGYRARRDFRRQIGNTTEIEENVANINDTKQNTLSEDIKNQPDENKAAIIIQKNYKGCKARKQIQSALNLSSASNSKITENDNGADIIDQHKNELTLNEENAALIIQKNLRGYTTRQQFKTANYKEDSTKENDNPKKILIENAIAEEEAAAVAIQKTYRSYKSRSELKKRKEENLDSKLEQKSAFIEELDKKKYNNYARREQIQNEAEFSSNENSAKMPAQSTNVDNNFSPKQTKQVEKFADRTSENTIENEDQILATDVNNKIEEEQIIEEKQNQIILPTKENSLNFADDISSKDDENSENIENKERESSENVSLDNKQKEAALTIQAIYRSYIVRKKLRQKKENKSSAQQQQSSEIGEHAQQNKEKIQVSRLIDTNEERAALILQKSYTPSNDIISEDKNEGQDVQDFFGSSDIKEKAAVTIQKTYKGHKTRRDLKQIKEQKTEKQAFGLSSEVLQLKEEDKPVKSLKRVSDLNSDGKVCQNDNRTQTGHRPEQEQETISQPELADDPVNTNEIRDDTLNPDNGSQREEAVLTIQKTYRGWRERRTLKSKSNAESSKIEKDSDSVKSGTRNQKTYEDAASTIQKNYRRYRTKRNISRETGQNGKDEDNTSLNKEKAALTIQTIFRGYKARQILKKGKFSHIESISDEGMPETDVDRNASIEQVEEDQDYTNESEERAITKRFSAVSATGLSDAETARAESRNTIDDEMSDIENLDLSSYADDSLEGMYYSLRKNEITLDRMQRRASERKSSLTIRQLSRPFDATMYEPVQQMNEFKKASSIETIDGSLISVENQIVVNKKNQEFLENMHQSNSQPHQIIESDNVEKAPQRESYEDDLDNHEPCTQTNMYPKASFESPTEATTKESEQFLDKLHGTLQNVNQPVIDEETSATIRKKMLAYSVSDADSDHCEVAEEKINAIRDDFNISTALETVTSTDTDSTIISAASKIQAGARGFLTRRRLRRASVGAISTQSEKYASFGNDAIDESLENLIEENTAIKIQDSYRGFMQHKSHTTPSPSPTEEAFSSKSKDSDDKNMGITDVKLEHKLHDSQDTALVKDIFEANKGNGSNITENEKTDDLARSTSTEDESPIVVNLDEFNLAARRMTLQRGDAVQKDSTPEDDADNVTSGGEHGKNSNSNSDTATDKGKRRRVELTKLFGTRQRTMPVQIDSEILRVIPKHLRKRIKSAEAQKKKRNYFQ